MAFSHFMKCISEPLPDADKNGTKITGNGMKTTSIVAKNHLFEIMKGFLVKMPRNPIEKEKTAVIPSVIGNIIENNLI